MTTTVHSIQINSNPLLQAGRNVRATRTSKSRTYGAVMVATATQRTVDLVAHDMAAAEAIVVELKPVVSALLASWGKTHEQVMAEHKAHVDAWFTPLFAEERRLQDLEAGPRWRGLSEATKAQAIANVEATGIVDPYKQTQHAYLEMARKLESAERSVANAKARNVIVGSQLVISWHKNISNARKAEGSRLAKHYQERGYTLAIRTDIEVTTK